MDRASSGKVVNFVVTTIFAHKLVPYPAEIKQSEKQYVKFVGNVHFLSPYPTEHEETTVVLASSNVLSHTQSPKPVNKQDSIINYGPYKNVQPGSRAEMAIHYENNSPFLTITSMTRVVEISHWGNIAIEETYDMYHSGAKLKGSFSRYDFQRNQDGVSAVRVFKTILPASARDVYYRDEIGNISTSHMREMTDSVELELRPRFPLFGGWKTHYYIGYNVPSYEYLYHKGDRFALRMRFVDHVFDDQVVDHFTLKVILPERVDSIHFDPPFAVQRGPNEVVKTYLDTVGRSVIVAHKANLVEQHIREFTLYYRFNALNLLWEPLSVIIAFYVLFAAVIVYVRLDFAITKDEASESRMRVAGLVEEVQAAHDRRSALYQAYEDAINKFKASKDQSKFTNDRKKIEMDHKALTSQIGNLQVKLKADSIETADKVSEMQSLDARYREQVSAAILLAEKLVSGKLSKQQYLESDSKISAKKEEIVTRVETIATSL